MPRPVLVTAGATRNPVDAIRYLSARSTGATGSALAARLSRSCDTTLLGSAEALLRAAPGPSPEEYGSTRDLMARMQAWVQSHPGGLIVHSAAVGDYEADTLAGKIPSGQPELVLRLRPAPKIIDQLKHWDPTLRLVSFKAADPATTEPELEQIARRQLQRTGSELVFANVLGRLGQLVLLVGPAHTDRYTDRGEAIAALGDRLELLAADR
jgi:phosphopantothenoylcysteine synthetase/decarboxylase